MNVYILLDCFFEHILLNIMHKLFYFFFRVKFKLHFYGSNHFCTVPVYFLRFLNCNHCFLLNFLKIIFVLLNILLF